MIFGRFEARANLGFFVLSTSQIFTYALLHLAAEPHVYLAPLREEAEEVISRHGWGKTAMREMHKVDSFLREAGRFNGLGCREFLLFCQNLGDLFRNTRRLLGQRDEARVFGGMESEENY